MLILLTFMVMSPLYSQSQGENVKVTLNDGKEIVGKAKSIDLKERITLTIGGIDVPIDMKDVAKIENAVSLNSLLADVIPLRKQLPDTILITDIDEYPDSIEMTIGTQQIKMRLVRGGDMLMGFDGKHSWAMCSEPVHKVSVTSFYMSDMYIRESMLANSKSDASHDYMYTYEWKDVDKYVADISRELNLPLRLPTEAEWEFSTYSSSRSNIFKEFRDNEWCSDFFDDYDDFIENDSKIDPVGPKKGKCHVVRSIDAPYGKLDRSLSRPNLDNNYNDDNISFEDKYRHAYFRLVIKAKDYISSKRRLEQ